MVWRRNDFGARLARAPALLGSALGEAGRLHGATHCVVTLVHELGEARTVGPFHAEAAIGHELAELGGLVDLLESGRHCVCDLGRQSLVRCKSAPGTSAVIYTHRLLERRHVLESRVTFGRHYGEACSPSAPRQRAGSRV